MNQKKRKRTPKPQPELTELEQDRLDFERMTGRRQSAEAWQYAEEKIKENK